jgi:hypothetical protein
MGKKNISKIISNEKKLEISLIVKSICREKEKNTCEECKETAEKETRKLMDDIWSRYPMAEVSRLNFENNSVVFEL